MLACLFMSVKNSSAPFRLHSQTDFAPRRREAVNNLFVPCKFFNLSTPVSRRIMRSTSAWKSPRLPTGRLSKTQLSVSSRLPGPFQTLSVCCLYGHVDYRQVYCVLASVTRPASGVSFISHSRVIGYSGPTSR